MAFFKKLKSKKSFSVFSSGSPNKRQQQPLYDNNTSLSLPSENGHLINGNVLESGSDGNNRSFVIGEDFTVAKGVSRNFNTNFSQNTSFLSHTKSFISNKLKNSSLSSKNSKNKINSSINDSFNSATNSNSSPANQSLSTSRTPPSPSSHNQASQRTLVVYHIDSETEGSFNLNVKVSPNKLESPSIKTVNTCFL
jgi:hypothetical protein